MSTHSNRTHQESAGPLLPHDKGAASAEPTLKHFGQPSPQHHPSSPNAHEHDKNTDGKEASRTAREAHEPHVPKDNKGKYAYYKNAIEKSGGKFDSRPGQRNIIGLRGFQNGKLNDNERDKYNDTIAVMWVDDHGKPHVEEYVGSVDPGKTAPADQKAGMAHLMDGQYDYRMGQHHGKTSGTHDALVDTKSHVWRDKNNNGIREAGDNEETGQFGINIHAGGHGSSVGPNSVGCQVIKGGWDGKQWTSFMQSMKDDPDGKFKYTLIDGSRLAGFEEQKLGDEAKAPDGPSKGIDPGAMGHKLRTVALEGLHAAWNGVKQGWDAVKGASSVLAHQLLGSTAAEAAGHSLGSLGVGAMLGQSSQAGAEAGGHAGATPDRASEKDTDHTEHAGDHDTSSVTADDLRKIVPGIPGKRLSRMLGPLNQAMKLANCTTEERRAMFIAQLAHESGGFRFMHELGAPSYFDKYEPGTKKGKDLGNTEPGDGARFKGRGFIQITGRSNYEKAGKALGIDLVNHPERAEEPEVAGKIAAWYWRTHTVSVGKGANKHRYHLNELADQGDFLGVTRGVNGGYNGLKERQGYYARAKAAFDDHREEQQEIEQPGQKEPSEHTQSLADAGLHGATAGVEPITELFQHYSM